MSRYTEVEVSEELRELLNDYSLVQAAKYYNVAPWHLLERPTIWKELALIFMQAESEARESIEKFEQARAQRG